MKNKTVANLPKQDPGIEPEWRLDFINKGSQVLSIGTKIVSSLLAFSWILFVLGWICAKGYMRQFHAEWIVDSLPIQSIYGFALTPGLLLAGNALYSFAQFLDKKDRPGIWMPPAEIIGRALPILIFPVIAGLLLGGRLDSLEAKASFVGAAFCLVFAPESLSRFVLMVRDPDRNHMGRAARILVVILLMTLWIYPTSFGSASGIGDSNFAKTTLPRCKISGDSVHAFLLIHSTGDRNYVAKYDSKNEMVSVLVVENKDIEILPTR